MVNEIRIVQGEPLDFIIYHEEDDARYTLKENEQYRVKIKKDLNDEDIKIFESATAEFGMNPMLDVGTYCFEVCLVTGGIESVISPVTDKNGVICNKLIVTERL